MLHEQGPTLWELDAAGLAKAGQLRLEFVVVPPFPPRVRGEGSAGCMTASSVVRRGRWVFGVLALTTALSACGGGGKSTGDPLALSGKATTPCTQAIMDGHNHEGAGQPSPVAFLPSLRDCHSLAEWTAAANAFGIKLNGREAQFVDNTCNADTTSADVKASQICRDAKAAVNGSRPTP